MGLRDDIQKLTEKYGFLKEPKNRQVVEKLTGGLVSIETLEILAAHVEGYEKLLPNLDNESADVLKGTEEMVKTLLDKGFIGRGYETYTGLMSKDAYFEQVVKSIEQFPREDVVKSKLWEQIYETALAERTEYSNAKYMEFVDKTDKINDMHARYTDAKTKYEAVINDKENFKQRELFRVDYPDGNLQKLDSDIKQIQNSEAYTNARQQVEDFNLANTKATKAVEEYNVADAEYKTLFENKTNELAAQNGYTVDQFKKEYENYPKREALLQQAIELRNELQQLQNEVSIANQQIPMLETEISKRNQELPGLESKRNDEKLKYITQFSEQSYKNYQANLTKQEQAYNKAYKETKRTVHKSELESTLQVMKASHEQIKTDLLNSHENSVKEYREKGVFEVPSVKTANNAYNNMLSDKQQMEAMKDNFQKKVSDFNLKMQNYLNFLNVNKFLSKEAGITNLVQENYSPEFQEKVFNVDLDSISAEFKPFHELDAATKDAKAKVDELDTKQKDAQVERAEKAVPQESTELLENYEKKLAMQKEMRAYSKVAGKLYDVEEELVSNDYKMEKPDLFTEILKSAGDFWKNRELRKGSHENTTEYNEMIGAVDDLQSMKGRDENRFRELLTAVAEKTKTYLEKKESQWRIAPSALRRTRMAAARDLLSKVTKHLDTMDKVNAKYEAIQEETLEKMGQLEQFKNSPVFKAHKPMSLENTNTMEKVVDNQKNMEMGGSVMA